MKYPYMIRRIKKRVLTWFFEVEYETLYFKTIKELLHEYKKSDIAYQLKGSKYEVYYEVYDVAKTLNYKDGLIESNKYYNEYINKLLKDNDIDYRVCDTWKSEVK